MFVNDFMEITLGALFGELAGYSGVKGITHLAVSEGIEGWDTSGVVTPLVTASGLIHEVARAPIGDCLFLTSVHVAASGTSIVHASGIIADISSVFGTHKDHHFNGLRCTIRSGVTDYERVITSYDADTELLTLSSVITGMASGTVVLDIQDVIAPAGVVTNEVLMNFKFPSEEYGFDSIREEGLFGAGSNGSLNSGYLGTIRRYKAFPFGGNNIEIHRAIKMTIPSGFFT